MKKNNNITTVTYDAGMGWRVDIVEEGNKVEAYLYNECCCTKDLMWGEAIRKGDSIGRFIAMVELNLPYYIADYIDDHMCYIECEEDTI